VKLLTDLPVEDLAWRSRSSLYASRWKLETYHKVLKSGCQAEQAKLAPASADQLWPSSASRLAVFW